MPRPDIYDTMPDGDALRERNRLRAAELERAAAEEQARYADMIALAELCRRIVQPPVRYVL